MIQYFISFFQWFRQQFVYGEIGLFGMCCCVEFCGKGLYRVIEFYFVYRVFLDLQDKRVSSKEIQSLNGDLNSQFLVFSDVELNLRKKNWKSQVEELQLKN